MKALEINKLVKSYGGNNVLKSISFSVEKWDFCALLWYNWAWKTTIIGILTDLVRKDSWKVKIFWIDIDKDFANAKTYIWVVPQEFNFAIFQKVKDIPVIQAGFYGVPKKIAIERTEKYLKILWLWDKRNNQARELSGGMKRRLMIVRALIHEPKILILDEPTAWVDVELRESTWDFIKKLNKSWITILLTTHYLEEVEALCNKVVILNKWNIIENTTTRKLLNKLDEEVIILNFNSEINKIWNDLIKKYKIKIINKKELEVSISKKHSITRLIEKLSSFWIEVSSFRNKRGRLEQLFIKLMK